MPIVNRMKKENLELFFTHYKTCKE